ncbi:hypothetical protein F5H01DRAFT_75636 [Linnemannia elongata]|nr:hypothetical protein F5H01DRAFT_75636 [Linnemannia elongata]
MRCDLVALYDSHPSPRCGLSPPHLLSFYIFIFIQSIVTPIFFLLSLLPSFPFLLLHSIPPNPIHPQSPLSFLHTTNHFISLIKHRPSLLLPLPPTYILYTLSVSGTTTTSTDINNTTPIACTMRAITHRHTLFILLLLLFFFSFFFISVGSVVLLHFLSGFDRTG